MNQGTVVYDELVHQITRIYLAGGQIVIEAKAVITKHRLLGGGIYQVFDSRGRLVVTGSYDRSRTENACKGDTNHITVKLDIVDSMTREMAETVATTVPAVTKGLTE